MSPVGSDAALVPLLEGRYDEATEPWEHAYVACARGRFADAIAMATPLLESPDPELRWRARTTAGSAHRQLGRYGEARAVERFDDLEDPVARAHLRISRAADAVGEGDPLRAHNELDAATGEAVCAVSVARRRLSIRFAWVRAEVGFLEGDPATAREVLRTAERLAAGWPRHEAKTDLFLGVAARALGDAADAARRLARARASAARIGADPIVRVASELLGDDAEPVAEIGP